MRKSGEVARSATLGSEIYDETSSQRVSQLNEKHTATTAALVRSFDVPRGSLVLQLRELGALRAAPVIVILPSTGSYVL